MVDAYTGALRTLKLPAHDMLDFHRLYEGPRERQPGGFWKGKSKAPYEWGPADMPGRVPWCAFVGYQVRYDGVLRLRPSSIKKEVVKHNHILSQVGRFLRRRGQARSKKQILYRFRQRLRCIAVGAGTVGDGLNPPAFSWTQGFRLLRKYPSLSGQLRDLDRHRVSCVRALSRKLKCHGTGSGSARPHSGLAFEGFPFSYAGLAERNPHARRPRIEEGIPPRSDNSTGRPVCPDRPPGTTTSSEACGSSWSNTSGVEADKKQKLATLRNFGNWWLSVSSGKKGRLATFSRICLIVLIPIGYLLFELFK